MSAEADLLSYGWPTLLAASFLTVSARYLLIEIKNKRATNDRSGDSPILTSINESLKSIRQICREIIDANAQILAQANDIDATEDDIKKELERVYRVVSDLNDILKNPSSPASNVRIIDKEDEIIQLLNDIKIQLAGLK